MYAQFISGANQDSIRVGKSAKYNIFDIIKTAPEKIKNKLIVAYFEDQTRDFDLKAETLSAQEIIDNYKFTFNLINNELGPLSNDLICNLAISTIIENSEYDEATLQLIFSSYEVGSANEPLTALGLLKAAKTENCNTICKWAYSKIIDHLMLGDTPSEEVEGILDQALREFMPFANDLSKELFVELSKQTLKLYEDTIVDGKPLIMIANNFIRVAQNKNLIRLFDVAKNIQTSLPELFDPPTNHFHKDTWILIASNFITEIRDDNVALDVLFGLLPKDNEFNRESIGQVFLFYVFHIQILMGNKNINEKIQAINKLPDFSAGILARILKTANVGKKTISSMLQLVYRYACIDKDNFKTNNLKKIIEKGFLENNSENGFLQISNINILQKYIAELNRDRAGNKDLIEFWEMAKGNNTTIRSVLPKIAQELTRTLIDSLLPRISESSLDHFIKLSTDFLLDIFDEESIPLELRDEIMVNVISTLENLRKTATKRYQEILVSSIMVNLITYLNNNDSQKRLFPKTQRKLPFSSNAKP